MTVNQRVHLQNC